MSEKSDIQNPLHDVTQKVLEDWAMMLVDESPTNPGLFAKDQPLLMSWVNMQGTIKGTLCIVAQEPFLRGLAANLLGDTPADQVSEGDYRDAFKEMSNVLAGNFFTTAYGSEHTYDLLYPNVVEIDSEQFEKLANQRTTSFFVADDSPVCVTFTVEG